MQEEAIWLVKSGEKVLGPFSAREVTDKLLSKEIVVIDEVARPLARWRYIRDEPRFAKTVEEIRRGLMTTREDTEVQSEFQGDSSVVTQTQTHIDDHTPTDFVVTGAAVKVPVDREVVQDADFIEIPSVRVMPKKPKVVRQYGVQTPSQKTAPSRQSPVLWALAGVVIVALVAFFILRTGAGNLSVRAGDASTSDFRKVIATAERAYRYGDFSAAFRAYSEAERLKPADPQVMLRQAILMVANEGQTVEGKRALQELLEKNPQSPLRSETRLALAMAEFGSEDFTAAKNHIESVLREEPAQPVALFDMGMVAFATKTYDEALKYFDQARRAGGESTAASLMAARTFMQRAQPGDLQSAASLLETALVSATDFRQEGEMLLAFIATQTGEKKKALEYARLALEADPKMTDDHFHDPLLMFSELEWTRLLSFCRELNEKLKTSTSRALYSICLVKTKQTVEAAATMGEVLAAERENPLFQTVNAFVMGAMGRDDEARSSLRQATKADAPALAWVLAGRECAARRDLACAKSMWAKAEADSTAPLAALTGLAAIARAEGRMNDAQNYLQKVLGRSPRYVPALRLLDEMTP
jgi:cytochrome c-type biogenesis protein CcmH/NrfG